MYVFLIYLHGWGNILSWASTDLYWSIIPKIYSNKGNKGNNSQTFEHIVLKYSPAIVKSHQVVF